MPGLKLSIDQLHSMARQLRRLSLIMTTEAGSGHPTTCLSCADIMAALFFSEMNYDPGDAYAGEMDAFVLSKGHAAPILYAALSEAGAITEDPRSLRKFGSPLEGHPVPRLPWVRVATGSLGQGLNAAVGMALARRIDKKASRVYVLQGDGESAEGSVWEAAQHAAVQKLDNLCLIVDINALGQSGPTMHKHNLDRFNEQFRSFGWHTIAVDGHDLTALQKAFDEARQSRERPTAILAKTQKGRGVSFLEGKDGWHGKPVPKDKLKAALDEIGSVEISITRPAPTRSKTRRSEPQWKPWDPQYEFGAQVATRQAYGNALAELGKRCREVVVLDGDVKNSTFSEKFKDFYPERFFESFIAEQNMIGMALGLAAEGKIPFASTFACFLTRAFDHIRMAGYSCPPHLVLCGSHAGVSIGEDGPSQMGLEDLAMMRSVCGSTVLYPCDAVSAERIVQTAALTEGVVYIRTTRPKTPVIYAAQEEFPAGGCKVLRSTEKDTATVIAAGVTVQEALTAWERLDPEGVRVRVIDAYSVKPIDDVTIRRAARETGHVIVVEDHFPEGGLGEAVAPVVGELAKFTHLAVREMPRSGPAEQLMKTYGIDADAIVAAVRDA